MKNLKLVMFNLSFALFIITVQLFGQSNPYPTVLEYQRGITHENAENGDYVLQVKSPVTDTCADLNVNYQGNPYSYAIVSGNSSGLFTINASTGLITINDNTLLTAGTYHLIVTVTEGTRCNSGKVDIICGGSSFCHYIDGDVTSGTGSGTYIDPWGDFNTSVTTQSDHFYFIKRGTVLSEDKIRIVSDTNVYIGAYGTGYPPVISNIESGYAVSCGLNLNDRAKNIQVYDIDVDYTGNISGSNLLRAGNGTHSCIFERMRMYSDTNNFESVLWLHPKNPDLGEETEIGNTYRSIEVYYSGGNYGIKCMSKQDSLINIFVKGCLRTSLASPDDSARYLKYYYSEGAGHSGLMFRASNQHAQYVVCRNSAIRYDIGTKVHSGILIRDDGINEDPNINVSLRDFLIDNVKGNKSGLRIGAPAQYKIDSTRNVIVERGIVKNCDEYGLWIRDATKDVFVNHVEISNTLKGVVSDDSTSNNIIDNISTYNISGADFENNTDNTHLVRNSIYQTINGSWDELTNYDFDEGDPYIDANAGDFILATDIPGTDLGYQYDRRFYLITGSSPSVGAYDYNAQPNPELISYWAFDNSSWDLSENYHTISLFNGASYEINSKVGKYSLKLDGTDDYGETDPMYLGELFTISMWAKCSSSSNMKVLISNTTSGSSNSGFALFLNTYLTTDGKLYFTTRNGTTYNDAVTTTGIWEWDKWNHVAVSVDRKKGKAVIYFNGVKAGIDSTVFTNFSNNLAINIGSFTNGRNYFDGNVDDVKIFNYALNATEIASLYKVPPTINIMATDASASEENSDVGVFSIIRDDTTGSLIVHYTINGTATSDDYSETLNGTIVIPNGQLSAEINITPVDDMEIEDSETVEICIEESKDYTVGTNSCNVITIADNDMYSNMVSYWMFDNNGTDATGNNHNVTLYNGASYTTDAYVGSHALELDGTDDYGKTDPMYVGESFTISMWARCSSSSNMKVLISNTTSGSSNSGFALFLNTYLTTDGKLYFTTRNGTTYNDAVTNTGLWEWDEWNHVAVSVNRTAGKAVIYFNGIKAGIDSTIFTDFANDMAIHIGSFTNNRNFYDGTIDDVRIYNYPLNKNEIWNIASLLPKTKREDPGMPEQNITGVHVYPIPVKDVLYVTNLKGTTKIEVISLTGELIDGYEINDLDEYILELFHLDSGFYSICFIKDDGRKEMKMIVKE